MLWLTCLPPELFNDPTSTVVESREGILLGARIADDGQWRFPESDSIPYRFEQSLLLFEDEYFYDHPGINPVSMGKAFWQNLTTDKRRGGSTLTQQVIRLSRDQRSRTYTEKLVEIFMATRLEVRLSKSEILSLYAAHAPFGGNVVGLETASWRYFGIPSGELSWGQAAALAVLPNAPSLVFPGRNEQEFRRKRDGLLHKLFEKGIIDEITYESSLAESLPGKPVPLPDMALHLTERFRKTDKGKLSRTTISASLQSQLNEIAVRHHASLKQNEVHNLAILLMDVDSREVLAYIGNSPTSSDHHRFVDIIDKPRSSGSILKPILFTAMLDAGEILPETLVADIPTVINGYNPENFDGEYYGAVPASNALVRSLNVPAVRMLRSFGLDRFKDRLEKLNLHSIDKPAHHYGLSMILGGAECSLWEVTNVYASLAADLNFFTRSSSEYRTGNYELPKLKTQESDFEVLQDPPVFDAGSIYTTLKSLREVNRPLGLENWDYFEQAQPVAWKTGTSFGFKDAWAVGVTPKYAIGVWVGNADGEGRPGLTGIQAAAPVFFDVLEVLPNSGWFDIPYDALVEAEVCEHSGHLAGVFCDVTAKELIPLKGSRTSPCSYHQKIFLDQSGQYQVNSSCYPVAEMQQQNRFVLPPVLEYYYADKHPEYIPLPAFRNDCLMEGEQLMEFIFPKRNETILLAKDFNLELNDLTFKVAHRRPGTKLFWYMDSEFVGSTNDFHEIMLPPKPGSYTLTVVDEEGNEIRQQVDVALASGS